MYENLKAQINKFEASLHSEKLKTMFDHCFYDTVDRAVIDDGEKGVFILTGDIPAMWLRDSCASIAQYIPFASSDADIQKLVKGLLKKLWFYIDIDPYGNSFMLHENDVNQWSNDETERNPYTWERKFEVDSLCYPFVTAYAYYKASQDKSVLNKEFVRACKKALDTFTTETDHTRLSKYYHFRPGNTEQGIPNHGRGCKVNPVGLIWSGYRPSDDACILGYSIPGNMFAAVALEKMNEMLLDAGEKALATKALTLAKNIRTAISKYAIVHDKDFGDIYAYETDGFGHYELMDDANVPSLMSIPYLGFTSNNDLVYQNTRRFALSKKNPFYFEGKAVKGEGSPHTPNGYVWPIGLSMQGLTSNNDKEKIEMAKMLVRSDADTNYTHESLDANNPFKFTREWFAWSDSLFAEFIYKNGSLFAKEDF
jgi:meiotically up-regulated gene 157 (Mug157) protein